MAQPTVAGARRASVAVKTEVTYNTDPVLGAADIVPMENVVYTSFQEQHPDNRLTGLVAQLPDIAGGRQAGIRGEARLRGAGVAYSASVKPEVDAILRAMGLVATGDFTVSAEKWDYKPQSGATLGESVAAAMYQENAVQGKILGAFATGRISARAGAPAMLDTTLAGLYGAPTDVSLITATLPTAIPPVFKSGAVTFDGVTTLRVSAVNLEIGNALRYLPSANDAQAFAGVIIENRRLLLTLDPEAVTAATYNFHAKRDAATRVAVSWQVGTVQYSRIKFSAPKVQILELSQVRRDGVLAYQLACLLSANTGGDELTLTFD